MADLCPKCGEKISKFDVAVNSVTKCPECKKQYHDVCWLVTSKCAACGTKNEIYKERKQRIEENRTTTEKSQVKEYINTGATCVRDNVNNQLNNEETGIFSNIGEKLKSWAKTYFIISVVFAVITFLTTWIIDDNFILVGLLAGMTEIFVAWAFSLILYAFGELVHNSTESKKIQQQILEELRNKKE